MRTSRTSPCRESVLKDSWMISRSRREIRRPMARNTREAMVMKPKPPTWMSRMITTWPKREKVTPVFTTVSPVTHTAEVAVKSASTKPRVSRSMVATGRVSSSAPSMTTEKKPMASIRPGLSRFTSRETRSHALF